MAIIIFNWFFALLFIFCSYKLVVDILYKFIILSIIYIIITDYFQLVDE